MRPSLLLASLGLSFLALGCAPKQIMTQGPAPTPAAEAEADAASGTVHGVKHRYVVKKGDTLWNIAARKGIYGDAFYWPLLYRQNRDQVSDPDLIYVRQDLSYAARPTTAALADARKKADATPAFSPHKAPRKELPIPY